MATQVGVIKQVSGTVVAVDANGKERILTAGDAIFFGEIVKTIGNNSNAVIAMDGGKDVSILANNTVLIDQNILNIQNQNINTIADINDLQKAILAGKDLIQLEETAAGGGDTGSGDGVSLGEARFAEGGHESNIYAYGRNINDTHYAFATPINSVGGANSDNSNIKDVIVLDTFVSLSVELKTAEGNDHIITEKELHDGKDGEKIVGELIVGKDIVVDVANDKIVISVDGRKIGDAKITEDLGNGKYKYELTNVRTEEFTDGTANKTGKIEATYDAHDKQGNHKDITANNTYEVKFDGPNKEDDKDKIDENDVYINVELKTADGDDNIITEKELHDGKDGEKIVGELIVGKDIVVDVANDKIVISVDGRKIGDAKITEDLGNGKYKYELTNVRTEEFTDGTANKTGKIEATYDAHDKQGNHKDITANNTYEVKFDHITIDAKVSLNVSEEGLPGGIKDSKGTKDTTDSVEDSKPINVTSTTNVAFEFDVKDGADSHLTSGGEKVIWKSVPAVSGGSNIATLVGIKEASGETVLKVTLDKATGATKVVLEKPVDHDPAGNGEDVVTANLPIKVTNDHGATAKSTIEINIQDDSPYIASDSTENVLVGFEQPRSNVTLVLDFSRSMFFKSQTQAVDANGKKLYEQKFENGKWVDDLDRPVLVEKTRLEIAHEGVMNLLNQYSLKGDENVKVCMVAFAGEAQELKSTSGKTWMSISEAKALVDKYFGGDSIKYDNYIWTKDANGEYRTHGNYYADKNCKIVLSYDEGKFTLIQGRKVIGDVTHSVNLPLQGMKDGTNYDAALAQAKDTFAKNGKITGADVENRLHFVSDGEPTMSDSRVGSVTGSLENIASIVYKNKTWVYDGDKHAYKANGETDYITSESTGSKFYLYSQGGYYKGNITYHVKTNHGIDDAEKAVWENWLINNKVIAESFALGNDAKLDKLDPIAYDGVERRDIDAKDFAELALPTKSFKGNIMDTLKEADAFGKTSIEFGADGAGAQAVAITLNTAGGVKTYTYTPGENGGEGSYTISGESMPHSGSNFTATLPTGSKITIDMVTGKYEYNPNADLAKAGKEESVEIKYSVTDADGDSVSATTTINTNGIAGFDHIKYGTMNGDTLNGTSGNDAILGGMGNDYIDGKGGHDALLGGEGNDSIVYHNDAKILDGGDGSDTLVIKHNIDFSNISGLDGKVSNFERIDLGKGGTSDAIEMTIRAEDVLDITDNKNTILKIDGDAHDTVKGGNWKVTHDVAADSGYTAYEGTTEKGQTIYIQINNEIKTDF
ncbi:retention module-containing protein [Campylobacter concisus]|uniref:retention module-containing protein n=1 Tax=Campylobacter concisus TaxID=199 RepID=UPI000CD93F4C|nr:retention module-containing protein [Campylobacter concisus]